MRLKNGLRFNIWPDVTGFKLRYNLFEANETQFVENFLQAGMTVFDIGANVGVYSILAGKIVGNKGRVFAIEPSQRERMRLRMNLNLNGIENVKIIPFALGSSEGKTTLYVVCGEETGFNRLKPLAEGCKTKEELVSLTTLNKIVVREGIVKS